MIGFTCENDIKKDIFPHYEFEDGTDMAVFGDKIAFPAIMDNNNGNSIILGTTGSGKTKSIVEPRIIHNYNSSLVIPVTKRRLITQYAPLLKERGYTIIDLNLYKPGKSAYGYDPMRTKKTESDLLSLATAITGGVSRSMQGESDPFWSESCAGCLAAIMGLARYLNGESAGFLDAIRLFENLIINYSSGHCYTNLDSDFKKMEKKYPYSQAPRLWRTLMGTSSKTASCIVSILNNTLSRFCGDYSRELFGKRRVFDISSLGRKKTALFITTNSISVPCAGMTNLLFSDIFTGLFEEAENNNGKLDIPVHVLCDEFATGSPIEGFSEHISLFREAGISCTILLQSLSQLDYLYGQYASSIIQENCDNLVYLGSNDLKTCKLVSERACLSLETVLNMKPGDEIFIRRGVGSKLVKRYKIFEDPEYINTMDYLEKE